MIRIAFFACLVAFQVSPALALREIQLVGSGHKLSLGSLGGSASFAKDNGLLMMRNPQCPTRSSIRIRTTDFDTGEVALPCENWTFTGSKYVYDDPGGVAAGINQISWKSQKMKVKLKGAGYSPPTKNDFYEIQLTVHAKSYCAHFDASAGTTVGKFSARGARECDALPTATPTPEETKEGKTVPPTNTPCFGHLCPLPTRTPTAIPTATGTPAPEIIITSPAHGLFLPRVANTVNVTGTVNMNGNPNPYTVRVNGIPAQVVNGTFSATMIVSEFIGPEPVIFNPLLAELHVPASNFSARDRHVVIVGDSLTDANCLTNSAACARQSVDLRLTESGIREVEPILTGDVDVTLSEIVPSTQILDNYEVEVQGYTAEIDAWTREVTAAPGVEVRIDPADGNIHSTVTLTDLHANLRVRCDGGFACWWEGYFNCYPTIDAHKTHIYSYFSLQRAAWDPQLVDVVRTSQAVAGFEGLVIHGGCNVVFPCPNGASQAACDQISAARTAERNQMIEDKIRPLLPVKFGEFLDKTDANGETPIESRLQAALTNALSPDSNPDEVPSSFTFQTPFSWVPSTPQNPQLAITDGIDEDFTGITIRTDTSVTAVPPLVGPNLTRSYRTAQNYPRFGDTTPVGHLPYDLGIELSPAVLNQLLKTAVELGYLQVDLEQLDLSGTGPVPFTAGDLSSFLPELGVLPPSTSLKIKVDATVAPVVTSVRGPAGELADLRITQVLMSLVSCSGANAHDCGTERLQVQASIDARLGVGLSIDNIHSKLHVSITPPAFENIGVVILANPLQVDEGLLSSILPAIISPLLPTLAETMGEYSLPTYDADDDGHADLRACGVEITRIDSAIPGNDFLGAFVDLTSAPMCPDPFFVPEIEIRP